MTAGRHCPLAGSFVQVAAMMMEGRHVCLAGAQLKSLTLGFVQASESHEGRLVTTGLFFYKYSETVESFSGLGRRKSMLAVYRKRLLSNYLYCQRDSGRVLFLFL